MTGTPAVGEVYLHKMHGCMVQVVGFYDCLPDHVRVLYEGQPTSAPSRITRIEYLVEI